MRPKSKLLWALALMVSVFTDTSSQSLDLSGEWQFQIDREDRGVAERWYESGHQLNDRIILPASMPQQLKGDDISVETKWVGSLYDSSYFYNPYMNHACHTNRHPSQTSIFYPR